jgi:hypothetical protein
MAAPTPKDRVVRAIVPKSKKGDQPAFAITIKLMKRGPTWMAAAELQTRDGPIRFMAAVDARIVANLMARGLLPVPPMLRKAAQFLTQPRTTSGATYADYLAHGVTNFPAVADYSPGAVAGGFFDDAWEGVQKVAKSKVMSDVLNTAKSIVRNPAITMAATMIPGVGTVVGPALTVLGTAINAAEAAKSLIKDARRGKTKALNDIKKVANMANKGDPRAIKARKILAEVAKAPKNLRETAEKFVKEAPKKLTPAMFKKGFAKGKTIAPLKKMAPQMVRKAAQEMTLPPIPPWPTQPPTQWPGGWPTQMPGGWPTQMPGGWPTQMPGGWPTQMPGGWGMPQQLPGGWGMPQFPF